MRDAALARAAPELHKAMVEREEAAMAEMRQQAEAEAQRQFEASRARTEAMDRAQFEARVRSEEQVSEYLTCLRALRASLPDLKHTYVIALCSECPIVDPV